MKSNYYINQWAQFINESTVDHVFDKLEEHIGPTWGGNYPELSDRSPQSQNEYSVALGFMNGLVYQLDDPRPLEEYGVDIEITLDGDPLCKGCDDIVEHKRFKSTVEAYEFLKACFGDEEYDYDNDDSVNPYFTELVKQFAQQVKNKVVVTPGHGQNAAIKPGTYTASVETHKGLLEVSLTFTRQTSVGFARKPFGKDYRKERGELTTPNLPKE